MRLSLEFNSITKRLAERSIQGSECQGAIGQWFGNDDSCAGPLLGEVH